MDGDLCSYYALIWNTISLVTFCLQHVKVIVCEWLEKKRYSISDRFMWKRPFTFHNLLSQEVVK